MTGSVRELLFVLGYDHRTGKAFWVTPSECARMESALPTVEQIPDDHERHGEISALAGPRPIIMVGEV